MDNVLTVDVLRTELVMLAGCYVAWQIVLRKDRAIALETSVSDWKFALSGNRLPLLIRILHWIVFRVKRRILELIELLSSSLQADVYSRVV